MTRAWQAYVAAVVAAVVLFCFLDPRPVSDVLYGLIGLSCVLAIVTGLRRNRPARRRPWVFLAAGQATWVLGDTIYSSLEATGRVAFPSVADVSYLVSYPLLGVAFLLLTRAQQRSRDVAGLIDAVVVTATFALLAWAFVADPILEAGANSLGDAVSLAYPLGDLVLLGLLMRLVTGQGTWSTPFVLLVAGAAALLAADSLFAVAPSSDSYALAADVLWLSAYGLWGAAALHPEMARTTEPVACAPTPFTKRRLALLGAAALLPLELLVVQVILDVRIDLFALVVGAAVLPLLVMARMAIDIEEIKSTARQRDVLRDDLFHLATRDEVTGVANRPFLIEQTSSALRRGLRDGTPSAVLHIRLPDVTRLSNDEGFTQRDQVLREVARRIVTVVDQDECVGRLGAGEFVVLVDRAGPVDLIALAEQLLQTIDAPFDIGTRRVTLSADIGISVSQDGSTDADALLQEARLAAESTQTGAGRRIEFFDMSLRLEQARRADVEAGLVEALDLGGLELHYQPVAAIPGGAIVGYEALLRWDRPGVGMQLPDSFVPIAEKSDLVCDLGRWALLEATRQLVAWTEADPETVGRRRVAVNISGRHLSSASIVDDVAEALALSGVDPRRLILEITETVLVEAPRAMAQLTALRELGVRISVDDFGTGYTSIGQLGRLPADILKIDRGLVASSDRGATELLALIVEAGHACGLMLVAEGIEDPCQLETVRDLGYDYAQGFLLARPVAAGPDAPRLAVELPLVGTLGSTTAPA